MDCLLLRNAVGAEGRFGPGAQFHMQLMFPGPDNVFAAFFAMKCLRMCRFHILVAGIAHANRWFLRAESAQHRAVLHLRSPGPGLFASVVLTRNFPGLVLGHTFLACDTHPSGRFVLPPEYCLQLHPSGPVPGGFASGHPAFHTFLLQILINGVTGVAHALRGLLPFYLRFHLGKLKPCPGIVTGMHPARELHIFSGIKNIGTSITHPSGRTVFSFGCGFQLHAPRPFPGIFTSVNATGFSLR